jgi:hypothetical protein
MSEPGISIQGIIFIDVVGLGLVTLILHLVRTHRLYVGYALLWFLSIAMLMITVSFPPLLTLVTKAVGAILSASALSLLAFMFIFLVLVFISVKLSILSARQVELIQFLALKDIGAEEEQSIIEQKSDESGDKSS